MGGNTRLVSFTIKCHFTASNHKICSSYQVFALISARGEDVRRTSSIPPPEGRCLFWELLFFITVSERARLRDNICVFLCLTTVLAPAGEAGFFNL